MLDVPASLIQHQRSTESEQSEDLFRAGLPQSYSAEIQEGPKGLGSTDEAGIPKATLFQHNNSLPNYLLHHRNTLLLNLRKNSTDSYDTQQSAYLKYGDALPTIEEQNLVTSMSILEDINQNPQAMNQRRTVCSKSQMHLHSQQEKGRSNFLSSAADLEYSTLSSILQENVLGFNPDHLATSTEGTPNSVVISPAISPRGKNITNYSPSTLAISNYAQSSKIGNEQESLLSPLYAGDDAPSYDPKINQFQLGFTSRHPNILFPDIVELIIKSSGTNKFRPLHPHLHPSFTIGITQDETDSVHNDSLQFKEPEEIYAKVSKPFLYTPGFHKLIAYLRGRFSKDQLVKMAESMAVYRPSFIACINSLRESDLIFMEQAFQRTLLTYDNFLKVSGTPTIVWRRTGEIAYVGKEFTILTGWTPQQLLGNRATFIVELLDDQSVVEYFQLFSKIAFGDFLGATMTECTLITPNADIKIRAGCIWTLKRDVFGIPMMIIGNFLPIV